MYAIRSYYELLEDTGEFTVNIPMSEPAGKILGYCGTNSGRDVDKVKKLNLTLEEGRKIKSPGIKELPLTLECKIIYRQFQDAEAMPPEFGDEFYVITSYSIHYTKLYDKLAGDGRLRPTQIPAAAPVQGASYNFV